MKTTFQGEVQLAGWSETHTGGAKVTFWLPDDESLAVFKTLTAKKGNMAGHRFMAVLVEIGDDEQPVQQIEEKEHIGALGKWCVLRCGEQQFRDWLNITFKIEGVEKATTSHEASDLIKFLLNIGSRKEIDQTKENAMNFKDKILWPYQKWLIKN